MEQHEGIIIENNKIGNRRVSKHCYRWRFTQQYSGANKTHYLQVELNFNIDIQY